MPLLLSHPFLDALIALALIYALLSVLVSILLESWNHFTKERGTHLQRHIFRMLDDPINHNFGFLFYHHPLIANMRRDGNSYPHYIASEVFANVLIDVIAELAATIRYEDAGNGTYVKVRDGYDLPLRTRFHTAVRNLKDSSFKRMMENFIGRNGGEALDLDKLKGELERWFDDQMARTGGQYKNDQRWKLRLLGLAVAFGLNIDALHLTRVILLDSDMRDRLVEQADALAANYQERRNALGKELLTAEQQLDLLRTMSPGEVDSNAVMRMQGLIGKIASLQEAMGKADHDLETPLKNLDYMARLANRWQLPLGWHPAEAPLSWFTDIRLNKPPPGMAPSERAVLQYHLDRNKAFDRCEGSSWLRAFKWLLGILITGISLSFGAPFWFETLVKLVNIRRSGAKPKSHEHD